MNPHPHFLVTLPTRARFGLVSVFCATLLVCLLAGATNVKAQQPTWKPTGSLGTARNGHTGTLLANGKVLVAGGTLETADQHEFGALTSAELYDPATGTWSITGNLNTARDFHTATALPNGNVLVLGGDSAELYDPATGTWSITGNLNTARDFHTATLLTDGKVLVAGGFNKTQRAALTSSELFDPVTGIWSITGNLNTARSAHTATLLSDGKVLVAVGGSVNFNSAELYDPATGTWSITGNLNTARGAHTATLLSDGKVLVAGGGGLNFNFNSAELYDPATGTWSITGNLNIARESHTATLLPSGKVMVAAGYSNLTYDTILPAELYDPTTGMWSYTSSLFTGRAFHTMMLLPDGKVLVAGGLDFFSDKNLSSAELFDTAQIKTPQITGASISGKKLFVEGKNFDVGAKIIMNDETHKSANDELTSTTLLVGKKAGRWIGLGETVRLRVRNSDGTESPEFSYTRPAQ